MKIDTLDVYLIKSPLIHPWKTAYGEDPDIFSILVSMTSGNDIGWSEASPLFGPTYSPECAWGVYYVIKQFLAPLLVGEEFADASEINAVLSRYKGNPFAKSALEIAWWTLDSKMRGKPLHELLGGTYHPIAAGADFGVQDSIDTLLKLIDGAIADQMPRIKLKAMPGWDLQMLQAVTAAFPHQVFHIDCNACYSLDDLPLFREIDQLGLAMIEQPLFYNDLIDHAKLQAQMETPICLDESISSPHAARQAIEIGACRYINLKPGRLGGLQNTLEVNRMCREANIGCWVGSMLETALGAGICIELASIGNMTYPSDLFPSDHFFAQELSGNRIELSAPGYVLPSLTPGNAFVPDRTILAARTLAKMHFEAKKAGSDVTPL